MSIRVSPSLAGLVATMLPAPAAPDSTTPERARISLHGQWERWIGGELYDRVEVPASLRPLGYYTLRRQLTLPRVAGDQRAFLRFEAITYHGRAVVNGAEAGVLGPYVPYEFDVTRMLREGPNTVEIAIADLAPGPDGAGRHEIDLGLNPGWEGHGGIIRDAFIEIRPSTHVSNVRLAYELAPDYASARCRLEVFVSSVNPGDAELQLTLSSGQDVVARAATKANCEAGANRIEVPFEVAAPLLWSPAAPNLYRLAVTLKTARTDDHYSLRTGFRDLKTRGRQFELNGKPLILNGVCRHDMWKDQGFTLTAEQMRRDMRMIKLLGANYVRLAHYPHHRYIIDLADELGLFVTEEPGHWNIDFNTLPRPRVDVSLKVLEGAIRRDWNAPSILGWLLGNECTVTVEYLREGRDLCKRLDPINRPVSFAHIYNPEPKKVFDAGGLDYYTYHQYGFEEEKFARMAEHFGADKPLVHTEWGWEVTKGGGVIYERSFDRVLELVEAGKIAGHAFWSWQDVREYTRVDWATIDGVLISGVVDEGRQPRERLWLELTRLFTLRHTEIAPASDRPEPVPLRFHNWRPGAKFKTVPVQAVAESERSRAAWRELEELMAKYWEGAWITRGQWKRTGGRLLFWKGSQCATGGLPFETAAFDGYARPLVVTAGQPELRIPIEARGCTRLHVLGNVTLPDGFPVLGRPGEVIATYTLVPGGGRTSTVEIRNGIETARANTIYQATRVDPIAAAAPAAVLFTKDPVRERYQALTLALDSGGNEIRELVVRLRPGAQPLAIFGLTAELA